MRMSDQDRIDDLEEALRRIRDWSEAYPPDIFTPMTSADCQAAHEVLKEHGMTIDRISAHAIRHALDGIGKIASAALNRE